ncbi:MAG: hypothetical protein M1835_006947 [Candelina submexicana]|nr:MAG: hypothetical protein M1835_006947 [Candelina submexicana]
MPREAEISLNERNFLLQALRENTRLDGRAFDAFRSLELSFGDEHGIADVKLGNTRVLARISASITAPFPDRKFDGIFTITTELSPMASPAFEVNRQTPTSTLLSRLLEKAIRRSNALSTESLCITAGSHVWSLRADVHVLSHDGGLVDASCIAVLAALQHFRLPDVSVSGGKVKIYTLAERVPVKLAMMHIPICVTFSFFEDGEIVLVDATLVEEGVREGELVVTINKHGEVCQVAKMGGKVVDAITLLSCTNIALAKAKEITAFVDRRLEEDAKLKDIGGLIAELSAENER